MPLNFKMGSDGILWVPLWKSYPFLILELKLVAFTNFSVPLYQYYLFLSQNELWSMSINTKLLAENFFSSSTFRFINVLKTFVSQTKNPLD